MTDTIPIHSPDGNITPMGILQTLKSWFETDAETAADETTAESGDATPTETDDEPSLDPDAVRETRIESDETVPDELNEPSEHPDADESSSE
ncbi:MAG: hypothetical protein J07HN6_02213 [Halonotius sp. J07HN6]|nr:MAG: hypothetical protein J07HN6_02213 [Halonotius sp. J07HN6]